MFPVLTLADARQVQCCRICGHPWSEDDDKAWMIYNTHGGEYSPSKCLHRYLQHLKRMLPDKDPTAWRRDP